MQLSEWDQINWTELNWSPTCQWHTAFEQQRNDSNGGNRFTAWSPTLGTEDGMQQWHQHQVSNPRYLSSRWKVYREMSYRLVWKVEAAVQASSSVSTRSGTRRHPGPFSVRSSWCNVLSTCAALHASIFDTTTKVGTPRARAKPRCSLLVPTVHTNHDRWNYSKILYDASYET